MEKLESTNRLIDESSLYLYSHAHQKINWFTWGDEALQKAQTENKLIFISIGYAACHWCQMMSKECFENDAVAEVLNKYYVSILVDKEERPDLDQIYLNAVQAMTDNAGWPLNCFALSDGSPVFGGTYFTASQFLDILQSLQETYYLQFDKVKEIADDLRESLASIDVITTKEPSQEFSENDLKLIVEPWKRKFDNENGGTLNPPKFPLPNGKEFLMWASYYFDDEDINKHLLVTLDKMMEGAIYDQIGGGFFRYAVDAEWRIPHFEKMLYDNAQLVTLYAKGFRNYKDEKYKRIAEETIGFMLRELYSENDHAFYCSIAADSENGEGRFYMWTMQELKEILGDEFVFGANYYGIIKEGNPLDYNILYAALTEKELAAKYSCDLIEVKGKIASVKDKIFKARLKRQLPAVDKKIIASWNGMVITALLNAYVAFNEEMYLDLAKKLAEYIKKNLIHDNDRIYRCVSSKKPIEGFLDDYAFVIKAFILLFQLTLDEEYIHIAKKLTDYTIQHFYDDKSGMFFFSSDEQVVSLGRKMDFIDRAVPSSGSEITHDLMLLAHIYNNISYYNYAQQMLVNIKSQMPGAGPFISNWARLLFYYIYNPVVVKLSRNSLKAVKLIWEQFLPNIIIFPLPEDRPADGEFSSNFIEFYVSENGDLLEEDVIKLRELAIKKKREKRVSS